MLIVINQPTNDEINKPEHPINDGLIHRESLGGYRHTPQYDPNNNWHDYPEIKKHDQPITNKGFKRS